jgi:hypothetical protein
LDITTAADACREAIIFADLPEAKRWFESLPNWPRWQLFIQGYRVEVESGGMMTDRDMEAIHAKFEGGRHANDQPDTSLN